MCFDSMVCFVFVFRHRYETGASESIAALKQLLQPDATAPTPANQGADADEKNGGARGLSLSPPHGSPM